MSSGAESRNGRGAIGTDADGCNKQEILMSSSSSVHEEYDENGDVVKVGDLHFTERTLGTGSYASVVLARRMPNPSITKRIPPSLPESFTSSGSFSADITCRNQITEARNAEDNLVAVKIYSKSLLKRIRNIKRSEVSEQRVQIHTALEDVEREIALMKMMRHPNIVSLLQVIDSVDSDALYLVLEFVPL